jgi:putative hydrolase of HD superfamily
VGSADGDKGVLEVVAFLDAAEQLKSTLRTAHTSTGRRESVAEHSWRLALMAIVLSDRMVGIDLLKLLKIIVIHDLGEAIGGDVPAVDQRPDDAKAMRERADFSTLIAPLAAPLRTELLALWDEYEAAQTLEAKLAKGLDKLETIFQHNRGGNPPDFDYAFNLRYGEKHTRGHPLLEELRAIADDGTRRRMREVEAETRRD